MGNRPVRLVIFGSRGVDPNIALEFILKQRFYIIRKLFIAGPEDYHGPLDLVSGCCGSGADNIPFMLIQDDKYYLRFLPITGLVHKFPVKPQDWARYGKSAGPRRNRTMAEFSDIGIAVYDGKSRGTANMISEMVKRRKPVAIIDSVTGAVNFC